MADEKQNEVCEGAAAHHHAYEKKVVNRLARATGHLKSISGMVERGDDCSEILIQLAAVRLSLSFFTESSGIHGGKVLPSGPALQSR